MPIYQTAHYQVNASAVGRVKAAIAEFVDYVAKNEPGSEVYAAWQQKDDPTKFRPPLQVQRSGGAGHAQRVRGGPKVRGGLRS